MEGIQQKEILHTTHNNSSNYSLQFQAILVHLCRTFLQFLSYTLVKFLALWHIEGVKTNNQIEIHVVLIVEVGLIQTLARFRVWYVQHKFRDKQKQKINKNQL